MMQMRVMIEAVIDLPYGTTVPEQGRAFTLPSGDWVKPWVVLEMNDGRDLCQSEMADWGIAIEEIGIEWFEE